MKNRILNNWGLKAISVVFAIILWFVVNNINDPTITSKVYNIPIKMTNADLLTSQGLCYEVLNHTDTLDNIAITANRSTIDSLTSEDMVATADFSLMTDDNRVPIQITTRKLSNKVQKLKGNFEYVQLNVENMRSATLALKVVSSGTVSDGYMVGDVTADQNLVRISGPESVVEQVAYAEAAVTVDGFSNDVDTEADIKLFDEAGDEIDVNRLSMNIKTVHAKAEILQTKRVALLFETVGTPAEGYRATGEIKCSPESILVAGKTSAIRSLGTIKVDASALNLTGQTDNLMAVIDIEEYLPTGIRLADANFKGSVTVIVEIEAEVVKEIAIEPSMIKLEGFDENWVVELKEEDPIKVTFAGLSSDLMSVNADALNPYVSAEVLLEDEELEALSEGEYEARLMFELPNGIRQVSKERVLLGVTEDK